MDIRKKIELMKYILVRWPKSQLLMKHDRFHECFIAIDIEAYDEVGYMCPEDLFEELFDC